MKIVEEQWNEALEAEFKKEYFKELIKFVEHEYKNHKVYPPKEDVFNAFNLTPLGQVKVVVIGQDPYHNEGQSHGLCFSVKPGTRIPPSLRNILKELEDDLGFVAPNNGYLEKWAKQGVLLLNNVFTVRANEPNSHRKRGWEEFTDSVIRVLNKEDRPIVFILWGGPARENKKILDNDQHLIIESPHPSPLSSYRGFFGTKPFSRTNEFLIDMGLEPIDWKIDNI